MAERKKNFNKKTNTPKVKEKKTPNVYMISPMDNPKSGYCEYVMSREAAEAILADRNKSEEKMDPQKYLCDYVNSQYNLLGYCICVKYA